MKSTRTIPANAEQPPAVASGDTAGFFVTMKTQQQQPLSGRQTAARIQQETDTILLSFSCGKDSVALWLELKDKFTIIPFYMYLIPDLEFVEQGVRMYEDYFGQHIIRVPHPSLYRMLNAFVYQTPERVSIIQAARLPEFTYDNLSEWIGTQNGLDAPWTATGIRAADSPNRRSSINQHGAINWGRRYFYPIWDMRIAELETLLIKHNCPLPVDYRLFGRSFDGIDHRFLYSIRENFPDDYDRILHWFPLAELELLRYTL